MKKPTAKVFHRDTLKKIFGDAISVLPEELADSFDEISDFRFALDKETDRGCALMAAAFLDDKINILLSSFFLNNPPIIKKLLRPSGPLGSFSSRIDMAFALGLISNDAYKDLHLIRKIRNDFGHSALPLAFIEQSIANRCRELKCSFWDTDEKPRKRFINSIYGILAVGNVEIYFTEHRKTKTTKLFRNDNKKILKEQISSFLKKLEADIIKGDG